MVVNEETTITVVVHIPKAAGKTLRWIAKQQFDRQTMIGVPKLYGDPADFYRGLSAEQKRTVRLINDATAVGPHEFFERPVRYVTLLRDPVKRVLSWDAYQGRYQKWSSKYRIAKKVKDNAQTRALAGVGDSRWNRGEQVTEATFDQAKLNIEERFALVGTSERFDETVILAKRLLGWRHVLYQRRNVSPPPPPGQAEPSDEMIRRIRDDNVFDIRLYEYVKNRLRDAIAAQGPEFEWEVEALKRMNATHDRAPNDFSPGKYRGFYPEMAGEVIKAFEEEHPAESEARMVRAFRDYVNELATSRLKVKAAAAQDPKAVR